MTITVLAARNELTANAGQTIFNYTFKIFSINDLNVYITPAGQAANDSTDLTTAYTVLGVGDEDGGTITLTVGANLNDLVTIVSNIPSSRTTDYQNNGDFRPTVVNDDFDRVVSLVKKIEDLTNRGLALPQSQQGPKPLSLPEPIVGELLRWNDTLSGLENISLSELPVGTFPVDRLTLNYSTLAAWQADTSAQANDVVTLKERTIGASDGATGDVVSGTAGADGFSIVAHDTLPLSWVLRVELYGGSGNTSNRVRTNNISGLNTLGPLYVGTVGKNTIIGTDSVLKADEIVSCVVIGVDTMAQSKRPQNTVAIGNDCMRNISFTVADVTNGNVGIGSGVMYTKNSSTNCVAIGLDAFGSFKDAADRIIGDVTGLYHAWDDSVNIAGDFDTAVGFNALGYTSGDNNVGVGVNAATFSTIGDNNTSVGAFSGQKGAPSGATPADRSFLHGGSNNTFLGANTGPLEAVKDASNMTAIGEGAEVGSANTVALGRAVDVTVIGMTTAITNTDTTGANLQLDKGMTFGNTAQAGTSVLDWYAEQVDGTAKTFVPTTSGITFSVADDTTGTITRIGNRVFYDIKIESSGGTTAGTAPQITNMPFAAAHANRVSGHNLSSSTLLIGQIVGTTLFLNTWAAESGSFVISGSYPV